ncbi:MAG TPA: hypothetical protein HPP83_06345 [Candidatus Hydrogenedentes bacterium]|nr:hypothetical protein [Candidatus Hydrogenedentota bacterium]
MRDKGNVQVGVIMAGGSGERFWPLSRRRRPKQLLCLSSETDTMLGEAVQRIEPLIAPEYIYVATGRGLVDVIRDARVGVPDENVIAEPCKRNTAGCLAYAAAHMLARYGGDGSNIIMAVTTADHRIGDTERFRKTVSAALAAAEGESALVTVGVVPTRPETGYGYIQVREDVRVAPCNDGDVPVYQVVAFHEKPSRERAQDFSDTGHYFWNSGMFFWRISTFLEELEQARPALAAATRDMAGAMQNGDPQGVERIFEALEDISIDYALMEHASNVRVARADFPWDDIGAWPALDRTRARDENGNIEFGDPVVIDCEDTIVYNAVGAEDMAVSVIGMEDAVVVVTQDAVLVARKDRAQDVRHAVRALRERGANQI